MFRLNWATSLPPVPPNERPSIPLDYSPGMNNDGQSAPSGHPAPFGLARSLENAFSTFFRSAMTMAAPSSSSPRAQGPVPSSSPAAILRPSSQRPTHLVVMVNGLFGSPSNWDCLTECFLALPVGRSGKVHLHASQNNSLLATFEGIDTCGARLAEEIKEVVRQNPSLKEISVVGHRCVRAHNLEYCSFARRDPGYR